jgi:hypothetical protein
MLFSGVLTSHSAQEDLMSVIIKLELPEGAFSALRKNPTEFVAEMRLAAAVKWMV